MLPPAEGSGTAFDRVGEMGSMLGVDMALLGVVAALTVVDQPAADWDTSVAVELELGNMRARG